MTKHHLPPSLLHCYWMLWISDALESVHAFISVALSDIIRTAEPSIVARFESSKPPMVAIVLSIVANSSLNIKVMTKLRWYTNL